MQRRTATDGHDDVVAWRHGRHSVLNHAAGEWRNDAVQLERERGNVASRIESGGIDGSDLGDADGGRNSIVHGAGDRRSEQHRDEGIEYRGSSGSTATDSHDDVIAWRDGRHSVLNDAAGEWRNDAIQLECECGNVASRVNLVASTGVISGTPTTAGTVSFTVQVKDAANNTGAKALSIAVAAPPPIVITTSLPGGTTGTAYSTTLQASGGTTPYTWAITSGSLPVGLTLNSSTGQIRDADNFGDGVVHRAGEGRSKQPGRRH